LLIGLTRKIRSGRTLNLQPMCDEIIRNTVGGHALHTEVAVHVRRVDVLKKERIHIRETYGQSYNPSLRSAAGGKQKGLVSRAVHQQSSCPAHAHRGLTRVKG